MRPSPIAPGTRPCSHQPTVAGFTLVELLVVIAILAVLSTLVMSSVRDALTKVRTLSCLSNLRQIGMGMDAYANDNQDRITPVIMDYNPYQNTATAILWHQLLVPYIATHQVPGSNLDLTRMGVQTCPVWLRQRNMPKTLQNSRPGYGMNYRLNWPNDTSGPHFFWWMPASLRRNMTFAQLTNPSQRLLIGDSMEWHCVAYGSDGVNPRWPHDGNDAYLWEPGLDNFSFRSGHPNRHGRDRANYLMCDLSARGLSGQNAAWAVRDPSRNTH